MFGRAFEDHVFQQMRHTCFAVAFVTATHLVRDIDGHCLFRWVGENQNFQAVAFKFVLRDAFDRRDFFKISR